MVFGGSQGARAINQGLLEVLDDLLTRIDIQILWSTGQRWYNDIKQMTSTYGIRVKVMPYIQDMGLAYAVCDLLLCRAGATTVAEVNRLGIPAVYIPLPGSAGGHQEENARYLVQNGAARMILEKEIGGGCLVEEIIDLVKHPKDRQEMAEHAKEHGRPEAVRQIVDDIIEKGGRDG